MSKIVLITFGLIALSMGTGLRAPIETSSGNYDQIQQFLESFMDAYTGTNYTMTNCLTPAIQSKLDQILAASVGYMLFLEFHEVMTMYEEFLYNLGVSCQMCGLNQIKKSLDAGVTAKGKFWYEVNLAANLDKLKVLMQTLSEELSKKAFVEAGNTLGLMTGLLVPYVNPIALGAVYQFNQASYLSWWSGLTISLSINPKKMGPCGVFLNKFASNSTKAANDISMILSKNKAGFLNLFGDLASTLTFVELNYTNPNVCEFSVLKDNIQEVLTKSGAGELLGRYATRALSINTAFVNIKNCATNVYSCGQAYGTVIKYLLNWSIN